MIVNYLAYDISFGFVPRIWYFNDCGQVVNEVVGHHDVLGYTINGNIQGLRRNGRTGASSWGVIDNLTMNRTGNLLTSVTDTGAATYGGDFHASAGTSSYDSNGALVSDTGRGISSITRNEIDLPGTVTFSDGSSVTYCYAADGTKLRETRTVSGTATVIDWCGDLVLEKTGSGARSAKRLMMDGGYVDLATGNTARRHFVRDHLGSVRAVVDDAGTVLETDDYYPLGGPLPTGTSTALQPQKYQGKDWNATASFNVYDFGARLYDPALGRWLSQDPLAEKYQAHSPYLFCAGNPMRFVDPEGTSTQVRRLDNGTYEVVGVNFDDDDYNIYVATQNEDGDWVSTEESIGLTVSLYSFVLDDNKTPMIGSIINPDDASGSAFIKEMTEHLHPLMSYMPRALNNKIFDFKATGGVREGHFNKSEYYRGMPAVKSADSILFYGTARDIGNIVAGYYSSAYGILWSEARDVFDTLNGTPEPLVSVLAQQFGYNMGIGQVSEIDRTNRRNRNLMTLIALPIYKAFE